MAAGKRPDSEGGRRPRIVLLRPFITPLPNICRATSAEPLIMLDLESVMQCNLNAAAAVHVIALGGCAVLISYKVRLKERGGSPDLETFLGNGREKIRPP